MKKKLMKLALILFIIGAVAMLLTYFCFHFVTDEGITLVWHPEAGKPYVTLFIGMFGVNMISFATLSLIGAFIIKDRTEKEQ